MKPRQLPWKWLLLGLIAVLLVGLAILPREFGNSSQLADRVSQALSAWIGGEIKLTGPLAVRYFPDVSIRGGFELNNPSRLPLVQSISTKQAKISLDLAALMLGHVSVDALRLVRPEITLKTGTPQPTAPDQTPQALIANLLAGAPVGAVRVRDGTINLPTASGTETITKFDARFDASSGSGALSSFGSFLLRNETVRFALDSGGSSDTANGPTVPVSLTLTSAPVTAKATGTASFANGLQLDVDVQADMGNARRFLQWAGIPLPEGQSLQGLSATGIAHWKGSTLTFDDGSFTLDGNTAVGLLAVTAGDRPRVEGTLAFEWLALDPYLGDGKAGEAAVPQGSVFDRALLKYFDADLRISAAEITAPAIKLGRGGFTITAKGGVLASELGELELCGGSASGRIGLDISHDTPKATLTANLSDVAIDGCLQQLALDVPLKGTGGLKADVSTEGRTIDELVKGLSGSLKVDAENGAVPVDFSRLLTSTTPLEGEGWSRNSVTLFDTLNADCRLAAGHIWCQMFNMQTRRGLISGAGDVDLARQTLDWSLLVASHAAPLKAASQLTTETGPRVSIRGSLSQPMIRRADRPTLGEGSPQTSPAASHVSPR
jgi:AsmA protein